MTDPTPEPGPGPATAPGPAPATPPGTNDRAHDRMTALGREAQAAGERFGREAQAAGERLARDPTIVGAADMAARLWGLVVLAVGLWFFAQVTLGLPLPAVAWQELWPTALILIGLLVLIRGAARRRP
jgi:hypothetical protein